MKFKEFYLTEASPEYPAIKMFVDKIEKTMKDFSKNRSRYEKYEMDDGYLIPLKDIIDFKKFPKGGFLDNLSDNNLFLAYGNISFSGKPQITYNAKLKDGSTVERTSGGLYMRNRKTIVIPFMSNSNKRIFDEKLDQIISTLLHELTHAAQAGRGDETKKTAHLSEKDWYNDKNEKEAVLNQIHKEIEHIISIKIKNNKFDREEFNKTNDKDFIKEYVKVNNELAEMFEDVEEFEKWFNRTARWVIKYTVPILDERIDYLKTFHQEDWDDFVLDTYVQLKKKFKNVISAKVLRYSK